MKPTVYLESSIVSYYTSRPTTQVVAEAWREMTVQWWSTRAPDFSVFISEFVIHEISGGDSSAAAKRLNAVEGIPILPRIPEVNTLAKEIMDGMNLPPKAAFDSLHIAITAVHAIDYLVTWNCRHINNAELKPIIRSICAIAGFSSPEICTPEELLAGK